MMDPREKFKRLMGPKKTPDDYEITISESELRSFPEGRAFLADMLKARRAARKWRSLVSNASRPPRS